MRITTNSMIEAQELRTQTLLALAESGAARRRYITALRDRRSDDQLRHVHLEAMAASAIADKAAGAMMGIRHVEYAE